MGNPKESVVRPDAKVTDRLMQRFEQARRELTSLEERIRETRERLAVYAEPGGPDELQLQELLEERRRAALELGLVISGWCTLGGQVDLSLPGQATPMPSRPGPVVVQRRRTVAFEPPVASARPVLQERPIRKKVAVDVAVARQLLEDLGAPKRVASDTDYISEIDRLSRSVDRLDRWLPFPPTFQRLFVAHCTARARMMQHEAAQFRPRMPGLPSPEDLFPVLSRFSKRHRPGFVWGLDRNHDPEGEDWFDDTLRHWNRLRGMVAESDEVVGGGAGGPEQALLALEESLDEAGDDALRVQDAVRHALEDGAPVADARLQRLVMPVVDLLDGADFSEVRAAVEQLEQEDEAVEQESDDSPLPADWPLLQMTASQTGLLVGGSPDEVRRKRIEQALELEDLEWFGFSHGRAVQSVRRALQGGSVGLVLVLARFVAPAVVEQLVELCEVGDVPYVVLERAYGLTEIREALEARYSG